MRCLMDKELMELYETARTAIEQARKAVGVVSRANQIGPPLQPYAITRALAYLGDAAVWLNEAKDQRVLKCTFKRLEWNDG